MEQTKSEQLEQAYLSYPRLSPFVVLKLSMILHGVVLLPGALRQVQIPLYSFGKAEPFGIHFAGREANFAMPGAILLRDASTVYINYGEAYENPYRVDWDEANCQFVLLDGETYVDTVDFTPRPAFFGEKTSRGTPMEAVADVRAQKLILTAYQHCRFWEQGDQCRFCAFFTDGRIPGAVDCEDIFETVREAIREPGRFTEVYLSGGSDFSGDPPFSQEIDRYIRALQAIGRNFAGRFPCQLMAPAYKKQDLQRLYDQTGVTAYCPNIEVWDKTLFRQLCPGKDKWIGREEWIRRTLDAVEVFGPGKVYTQVVAGAELARPLGFDSIDKALASNFEACAFFAAHGVIFHSTIWRPHRSSRLGVQPMPSLDYYLRLTQGLHEIRKSYGLHTTNDSYKRCGNHPDGDQERLDAYDSKI